MQSEIARQCGGFAKELRHGDWEHNVDRLSFPISQYTTYFFVLLYRAWCRSHTVTHGFTGPTTMPSEDFAVANAAGAVAWLPSTEAAHHCARASGPAARLRRRRGGELNKVGPPPHFISGTSAHSKRFKASRFVRLDTATSGRLGDCRPAGAAA